MDAAGKPTTATRKLEPALEASFAKAMRSRGYIVKPDESMVASIAKIKASEKSASEQVGQHEGTGRKVAPDGLLLPEQTTNESILSESDASLVGIKSLSEGRPTDISLDLNSNVGTGALGNESQFEAI